MTFFGGGGSPDPFGLASGSYITHMWNSAASSAAAMTANQIYYMPIEPKGSYTFSSMGLHVTIAATAGKLLRYGIYSPGDGVPGNLLYDYGNIAADATGERNISINQLLPAGGYWLAVQTDGTPTVHNLNINAKFCRFGSANGSAAERSYAVQTYTFGAFPASASGLTWNTGITGPRVYLIKA